MEIYEIAAIGLLLISVIMFAVKMIKDEKATVMEWLVSAVVQAEAELGSGTGRLKLKMVYDMFMRRFPTASVFVSLDTFSGWVDIALDTVKMLLYKENMNASGREEEDGEY